MAWLEITGVINFGIGDITEDQFLGVYELFSGYFKGSEGGLNIAFTKTKRKNWSSSSEKNYRTEDIYRIENVVVTGDLRHIDPEDALCIVSEFKSFLYQIRDRALPNSASFLIKYLDKYWTLNLVENKIRIHTVKL